MQLLPEGAQPDGWDRMDSQALNESQVAHILRAVPSEKILGQGLEDEPFRISLAGAQEKTALLRHQGRWRRPHGATPTTHILKLPIGLIGGVLTARGPQRFCCQRVVVRADSLPPRHPRRPHGDVAF